MTRGIEREMYDRLLALSEKTVVALEKGNSEMDRLGDLVVSIEKLVMEKVRLDDRMALWMKVMVSMVGLTLAIIAIFQAVKV